MPHYANSTYSYTGETLQLLCHPLLDDNSLIRKAKLLCANVEKGDCPKITRQQSGRQPTSDSDDEPIVDGPV